MGAVSKFILLELKRRWSLWGFCFDSNYSERSWDPELTTMMTRSKVGAWSTTGRSVHSSLANCLRFVLSLTWCLLAIRIDSRYCYCGTKGEMIMRLDGLLWS